MARVPTDKRFDGMIAKHQRIKKIPQIILTTANTVGIHLKSSFSALKSNIPRSPFMIFKPMIPNTRKNIPVINRTIEKEDALDIKIPPKNYCIKLFTVFQCFLSTR